MKGRNEKTLQAWLSRPPACFPGGHRPCGHMTSPVATVACGLVSPGGLGEHS